MLVMAASRPPASERFFSDMIEIWLLRPVEAGVLSRQCMLRASTARLWSGSVTARSLGRFAGEDTIRHGESPPIGRDTRCHD